MTREELKYREPQKIVYLKGPSPKEAEEWMKNRLKETEDKLVQ